MTQSDLEKLRLKLPPKWALKLSSINNVTQDQVRKVLRGDSCNPNVIASAVRLANKKKRDDFLLRQQIEAL